MSTHAKRIIKTLLGRALIQSGVWNRLLRAWARRREAIILTYHRVIEAWDSTLDYSQPGMVVTAETFDRHLHFLKRQFDIVPLGNLIASRSSDRRAGRPRCVITFDDGWRDNHEIAFPILRKHGVLATVFLTTDFIGRDRAFWHTELIYLLLHGELSKFARHEHIFHTYPAPVRSCLTQLGRMRKALSPYDVDSCIKIVKGTCDEDIIETLIQDLASVLRFPRPLFPDRRFFLDWDQVREMAAAGIEIGSHGCSHRILTHLPRDEVAIELNASKQSIEQQIGARVHFFAFPNDDWNRSICSLIERAGYRAACNGGRGTARAIDPYPLCRFVVHEGITGLPPATYDPTTLALEITRGTLRDYSAKHLRRSVD